MKRKGTFWVHLSICLHPASPSPSPPPLLPEPVAKSEKEKGERGRERLSHFGAFLFPSPLDSRRCRTSRSPCHGGSPPPPSRFWSSWSPIGCCRRTPTRGRRHGFPRTRMSLSRSPRRATS